MLNRRSFLLVAGEASGDLLAAELVQALRQAPAARAAAFAPCFFGAGGPRMAEAGVELVFDLTQHAVVGLLEVVRHYAKFRRFLDALLEVALERQPGVLILVDFSGFNLRLARALRRRLRGRAGPFNNWRPRIVQYVSPQVWASRPRRARVLAENFDLLLCLFPFEKEWYARHEPALPVEFVGHPICDRHAAGDGAPPECDPATPLVLLLPGSRAGELERHLPILLATVRLISRERRARFRVVLPSELLAAFARRQLRPGDTTEIRVGGVADSLREAQVAIASTGTVLLECAAFGVPTVALYRTSAVTYQIARRIVKVPYLAMPNLILGETVCPEFIQGAATPAALATEALAFLNDAGRRARVRSQLRRVVDSLGGPGASARAAQAILRLLLSSDE